MSSEASALSYQAFPASAGAQAVHAPGSAAQPVGAGAPIAVPVAVVQPQQQLLYQQPYGASDDPFPGQWRAPFCGCLDDCESCLLAWLCPCILFGRIQEQFSGSSCQNEAFICALWGIIPEIISGVLTGLICGSPIYLSLHCFYHAPRRRALREAYGIQPYQCDDHIVSWCCLCCSLSQEWRELRLRGAPMRETMPLAAAAPILFGGPQPPQQQQQQPYAQQQPYPYQQQAAQPYQYQQQQAAQPYQYQQQQPQQQQPQQQAAPYVMQYGAVTEGVAAASPTHA